MKKIIVVSFLCVVAIFCSLSAQEITENFTSIEKDNSVIEQDNSVNINSFVNKRGIELLPKAGDFALGIEAAPFLEYLGNMFNFSNTIDAPEFKGINNTIYFKYFLENDRAARAKLHVDFTQQKNKQTVTDQNALLVDPTNISATTIDTYIRNNQGVTLDLGYEFRRGHGRVQGFYGPEISVGYLASKDLFEYGNPITSANQTPIKHDFTNIAVKQGYRVLENCRGTEFTAGIGGFIGVEYFFTPQISIGGELGLRFTYSLKGQNEITTEGWLDNDIKEYSYRERISTDNAFNIGGQTLTKGSIFLMFYF
ncbi:MAG: hypothetical protein FWH18_01735 [Marinilabiliaceae bacterium]|nr:hypothetical protein [Marinilabiliaceae bacterium]